MKMLIATGGTGGHIYPGIALANAAKQKYSDIEILFVGNENRMEAIEVPKHGYRFIGINASGLSGNLWNKSMAVIQSMNAYRHARKIIKEFKPDVVIGFGGYVSFPVMYASHKLKCLTLIHEQNSIIGLANKLFEKHADGVIVCYKRCISAFTNNDVRLYGNPRESEAINVEFDSKYYESLGLNIKKNCVLIVMGSLGSKSINEIVKVSMPLIDRKIQVCWVIGRNQQISEDLNLPANIKVVSYVDQLKIMAKVDLIVCRAGATTLAEICALGVAAILVPSPYVAHNHQYFNASVLTQENAAKMIEEKMLNPQGLVDEIHGIMNDKKMRLKMCANVHALSKSNACENILNWCDELMKGRT